MRVWLERRFDTLLDFCFMNTPSAFVFAVLLFRVRQAGVLVGGDGLLYQLFVRLSVRRFPLNRVQDEKEKDGLWGGDLVYNYLDHLSSVRFDT